MLADTEEVALSFESTSNSTNNTLQTNRIKHPIALGFHLLFRTFAIIFYQFSTLFYSNFITIFVINIISLSMDFWTVKNITGRLLVGLRWWNHIDEDGKSTWIFENRKNNQKNNSNMNAIVESTTEANIFWLSLIVADLIWIMFFFITLITFNLMYMTITIVALMLNGSNTYGFLKCKFGSEKNMQSAATSYFGKQFAASMFDRFRSPQNTAAASVTVNPQTATTN